MRPRSSPSLAAPVQVRVSYYSLCFFLAACLHLSVVLLFPLFGWLLVGCLYLSVFPAILFVLVGGLQLSVFISDSKCFVLFSLFWLAVCICTCSFLILLDGVGVTVADISHPVGVDGQV